MLRNFMSSPEFVQHLFKSSDYSRAVFINTNRLPERQSIEKRSIEVTELGDSDPFSDVKEG